MKNILSLLLTVVVFTTFTHAADVKPAAKPRDIILSDGTVYHHATIVGSTARTVMVASDEGTFNIPITSLPADMQKDLNYMTPEERKKAEAEKAALLKADAAKAEADKKARLEASKFEVLPGSEKDAYPRLNPDFFPSELASQISAYNTKAQYTSIIAGQAHTPEIDASIKANAQKLAQLHDIFVGYKNYIQGLPAGPDADTARKAVGGGDYKPYQGMPEIVLQAMMGVPDSVENATSEAGKPEKIYHYGSSKFRFRNGGYYDPSLAQKPAQ